MRKALNIQKTAVILIKIHQILTIYRVIFISHLFPELTGAKYSTLLCQKMDLPNMANVNLCFTTFISRTPVALVSPMGFFMEVKINFLKKLISLEKL